MNTTTVKEVTPKEVEASLSSIKSLVDTHKNLHSKMEVRNLVREHGISGYMELCVLLFEEGILYINDAGIAVWNNKIPISLVLAATLSGKVNIKNYVYANRGKGVSGKTKITKEPKRAETKQEIPQTLSEAEAIEDSQSVELIKGLVKESSGNVKSSLGLTILNFGILITHIFYQLYISK